MSTKSQVEQPNAKALKYVYFFGGGEAEGKGEMKDVLGGEGAGLAEMTDAGLPVPPGFTIQTEACREYVRQGSVSKEALVWSHPGFQSREGPKFSTRLPKRGGRWQLSSS